MGQLGNLESCEEQYVGPPVLAEVVKMGPGRMIECVCPYIYVHHCACVLVLLQGRKHRGQLISIP